MDRWNPIRQGASDVLVVPRSALLPNDPASVACFIEDALGHPEGREAFARWLGVSEDRLEEPEVRAQAMRALTQGYWQAIEVGHVVEARGTASDTEQDEAEAVPLSTLRGPATDLWFEAECVGRWGTSLAGATLEFRAPDGTVTRQYLDGQSRLRVENLKSGGMCSVKVVALCDATDGRRRPMARVCSGLPRTALGGPGVELVTQRQHVIVVEEPYAISC